MGRTNIRGTTHDSCGFIEKASTFFVCNGTPVLRYNGTLQYCFTRSAPKGNAKISFAAPLSAVAALSLWRKLDDLLTSSLHYLFYDITRYEICQMLFGKTFDETQLLRKNILRLKVKRKIHLIASLTEGAYPYPNRYGKNLFFNATFA